MVSDREKSTPIISGLRIVLALILFASYIPFVIGAMSLQAIPSKYLWVVLPIHAVLVFGLISLLIFYKKFANQKIFFAIIAILTLLLSVANIYAYTVTSSARTLINNIQPANISYTEYSVLVKKDNPVSMNNAKSVAILNNDSLFSKVQKRLAEETPANQSTQQSLAELTVALDQKNVELIAIRSATIPVLQDADKNFMETVNVLATFDVESDKQSTTDLDISKPFMLYVSGIDTAGPVSTTSRSDVNILLSINPKTRQIVSVNTPRDYYVQLHGTTGLKDKLTHAGVYGIDMSRATMQDLYGVEIPYYLRINFTSLVNIVNAIGPIEVYSDYDFAEFKKGYNTMNSEQALRFARERYSFQEGDRQRGRNQQHVIEAIVNKMSRPENAVKMPQLLGTLQSSVETNISGQSLSTLINNQLNDLRGWNMQSLQVDGSGEMLPTYSYGAQPLYVMIPNQQTLESAKQAIKANLAE